jgi:hypothetical protein
MELHHILVASSLLFFIIPAACVQYLGLQEISLLGLFFTQALLSAAFWANPIDGSVIHKMDGRLAKMVGVIVIAYLVFCVRLELPIFAFGLFGTILFFYLSGVHSSQSWCCSDHVACHLVFHFIASLMLGFSFFQ